MSIDNYLTIKEAAARIKVSGGRIYQYITEGRLRVSQRVGKSLLIDKDDVDKFQKTPRNTGRPKKSAKKR